MRVVALPIATKPSSLKTGTAPLRRVGVGPTAALTSLLLGLGLMLVAAAPAEAGRFKQLRFGVMDGAVDPGPDLGRMRRANVQSLRLIFHWAKTEQSRGDPGSCSADYDWSYINKVVRRAGRLGIRLLPVIMGSPSYVPGADRRAKAPPTRSDAIGDYKCFVRSLAERYGRGGSFVGGDPGVRPIREWQIWNEPSIPTFAARGKVNPREYGRLVKVSRRQLVGADDRAGVLLAGIPERYRGGMNARPFLRKLYRVKRIRRAFDAVAVHLYARNYRGIKGGMIRMRRHLRRLGTGGRALWLTETGWSTNGPDRSHPLVKSRKGQARQLRKTFRMLTRNRKRFKLGTVNWFRWRDATRPGEGQSHFDFAGLYTKGGEPKPSCSSFVRFTGGKSCRSIQSSTTTSSARFGATSRGPSPDADGGLVLSKPE